MYVFWRTQEHTTYFMMLRFWWFFFYEGNSPVLSMTCGVTSALAARVSSIKLHKKVSRKAYYSTVRYTSYKYVALCTTIFRYRTSNSPVVLVWPSSSYIAVYCQRSDTQSIYKFYTNHASYNIFICICIPYFHTKYILMVK